MITKHVHQWTAQGHIDSALQLCRKLAFEVSARVLLGCGFSDSDMHQLVTDMQVMADNCFTLPVNIPGSPFNKVSKELSLLTTLPTARR